jgi:NAD(P)-dependent dehydrogenase (short-subunit alcohol dehydrogenase family)
MQIQNAAVLITGGSRGLGAALGRELARRGARVVLVARGGEELDRVVEAIRSEGGEAHALVADVGDRDAIYPLVGAAVALVGPLDVVVHNASTLDPVPLRELIDTECEDFGRVLEVNLLGPFRLTKAVVGSMLLRGRGLVLGLSSDAAVVGYPRWGAYGASKAALDQLARAWAAELDGSGVRFLNVDPGEMDTRMHADAMPEADRSTLAAPADVARTLGDLIESCETLPNGVRLEVAALRSAA